MKNSNVWKGIAGLLVLILALALIPSLITPHQTMMVEFLKAEEADGLKTYEVSLTPETSNKKIEEIGIILQTGDEIRENLVKASSTEDDSWAVQFTVPADEPISVQPYVKYEDQEKTVIYEEAVSSDETDIIKTPLASNPVRETVLVDGANATYTCAASEIPQILANIADQTWGDDAVVQINVSGEASFDEAILFGQNTIFAASGKRLPIAIVGDGSAVLDLNAPMVTSANSFTFRNLDMPIGKKEVTFYAGAGNIVFESVDFGAADGEGSARFYGDTATGDVFANWNSASMKANKEAELIPTSITFSGDTRYTPATKSGVLMSAVGFGGKEFENTVSSPISNPGKLSASFIIDGATVSSVGARAGTAPVAKANLTMVAGSATKLAADGATNALIGEAYTGDTYLSIEGGSVSNADGIVAFTNAVHTGDVHVTISQGNNENPTTILGSIKMCEHAEIRGSAYLSIVGGQIQGNVYGAAATVTSYNNIINTNITGNFFGTIDNARRVVNTFSGSSVSGNFVGGTDSIGITRGVTNTISNTTVDGDFIGANRVEKLYGKVKNAISDSNFNKKLVAGNESGDVSGKISNTITGTTVAENLISGNELGDALDGICNVLKQVNALGALYGGNLSGHVQAGGITNKFTDVSVTGVTYGGNETGKVEGDIQNTISGNNGQFNQFFGGNAQGDVKGSIKNTVSGGTFKAMLDNEAGGERISFFAGNNGQYSTVYGNIENDISGGTFNNYWYAGNRFGVLSGNIQNTISGGTFGTWNGGGFDTGVGGNIKNVIKDGNFLNSFAGGNRGATDELATVQNIENIVEGGTFNGTRWCGSSINGSVSGSITNTVKGGNFSSETTWFGATPLPIENIQNNFNGGTFDGPVYCGAGSGTIQSVVNTVEGGTFNGAFAGGNKEGTNHSVINTVKGGTFNGTFNGASGAASNSGTIQNNFEGGIFTAQVYGGTASTNVTIAITNNFKGGTFEATSAVYGGSAAESVTGKIQNTVEGGTFNGTFNGGNNAGSNAAIVNTVKNGTFNGAFHGASNSANNNGTVQNNFEGGIFTAQVYGGSTVANINTTITNTFKGSTFETSSAVYGGSAAGTVSGAIQNTVEGSTFNGAFYGGSNEGSNRGITNTITTGTFAGSFFGASYKAKVSGAVQNTFNGGTFDGAVYGGSQHNNSVISGNIQNVFYGGTFNEKVYCGSEKAKITGTITNTFGDSANKIQTSATFNNTLYGGSQNAVINRTTSTLYRGNFFGNVHPGNAVNNYGSATDCAYLHIAPNKSVDNVLRFNGEVKSLHGEAECVKLTNASVSSTRSNIRIGENAYLKLDEYSNNNDVYLGNHSDGGAVAWSGHVCAGKDGEGNDVALVPGTIANAKTSKYQPFVVDAEKAPNGLIPGKVYLEYPRVERTFVLTCECGYELRAPMADIGLNLYGNASTSEVLQENVALDGMATVENIKVKQSGKKADGTSLSRSATGYLETTDIGTIHYITVTGTVNGEKFTRVDNPEDYPVVPTEALDKDSDPNDDLTDNANMVEEEKKLTLEALNEVIKVNDLMDQQNYAANGQNKEMTQALREQVVKYFELQTAFTWTPDESQKIYKTTNLRGLEDTEDGTAEKDGVRKYIDQGALYGGIPYQSHGNGNLYRWMEYYDETTGIFYLSQMMRDNGGYSEDGTFNPGSDYFYNQCSNGANWAWMRVCNTGAAQGSMSFGVSRGMIPVGGYTYFTNGSKYGPDSEFAKTMTGSYFDNRYQCQYIAKTEVGSTTYYVSGGFLNDEKSQSKIHDYYALVQPGDCISKSGHVMMAVKVDVQTKTVLSSIWGSKTKQIIDPELSTITMVEQIEGWGRASAHAYDTSTGNDKANNGTSYWNGYNYTRQGRARYDKNGTYTFKELADAGYLPFTFIEFQNFDPATQTDLDKTHINFYNKYILNDALDNVVMAVRYSTKSYDLRAANVYNAETGEVETKALISKEDLVNLDENGNLVGGTEKSFAKIAFSQAANSKVLDGSGNETKIVADKFTITPVAENFSKMTYKKLQNLFVYSNYFISDITATFTDRNGTVLLEKTSRAASNSVSMVNHPGIYDSSVDLNDGTNFVTISVQLSTGEKIVLLENLVY